VYVTEVVAENFQMLESRAAREGSNANQGNTSGAFSNDNGYAGPYGQQAPQQQGSNFARESTPYGNANPMDIQDSDLPF
jgi:single-stranded DNA-binding protein 2